MRARRTVRPSGVRAISSAAEVQVVEATLGDRAEVLGAIALVLRRGATLLAR